MMNLAQQPVRNAHVQPVERSDGVLFVSPGSAAWVMLGVTEELVPVQGTSEEAIEQWRLQGRRERLKVKIRNAARDDVEVLGYRWRFRPELASEIKGWIKSGKTNQSMLKAAEKAARIRAALADEPEAQALLVLGDSDLLRIVKVIYRAYCQPGVVGS